MRRPGSDPRRRNRKIGTADAGWKKDTPFVIPERWENWRPYYEDLRTFVEVHRWVHGQRMTIVVEATRGNCVHPCTPDDIAHVLELLPKGCVAGVQSLHGIVLRQPTHKQTKIEPVWGRLCYFAEVGSISGPIIVLEAREPDAEWSFERKLDVERQGELTRMEQLALGYESDKRGHHFRWGLVGLRRWMLYHTLIHEVGHWVDYLTKVAVPERDGEGDEEALWDRYRQRPKLEREAFAHRFSDEWRDELIRAGELPFARRYDEQKLREEKLDAEWFRAPAPADDEAGPPIRPLRDRPGKTRLPIPPPE